MRPKSAGNGTLLTYLQASTSENFRFKKDYTVTNLSKAFTGADLNTLAKDLGMTPWSRCSSLPASRANGQQSRCCL